MADSDSPGGLLQRPVTKLQGWLVPRLEASDRVSPEATALVDELLGADRDPERATEKLDDWVEQRK
jgi:hypothetical protein